MKKYLHTLIILFSCHIMASAQTYDSLQKLEGISQKVYFSNGAKERARKITENVAKAEVYFEREFNVHPNYTLLILSPQDWKEYAHPHAVYGLPHYLTDGRLIVASENNEFWKRNTPPLEKLPKEIAGQVKNTYADENGEITLASFFDLLAIHELGHAFQYAAGLNSQRNWMSELLCNVLLHTYVAENDPELLPALTLFPNMMVNAIDVNTLKYTTLEDFETHYNEIALNHPDNYGWFQSRFHTAAGQIYDLGGVAAMKSVWTTLLNQKEKLDDKEFIEMLTNKAHPSLKEVIQRWD